MQSPPHALSPSRTGRLNLRDSSTGQRDCAPHCQRGPLIESRWVEPCLLFIGKRNLLKLATGYHLFNIIESLWSALLHKLHRDRRAELTVPQRYGVHDRPALGFILLQASLGRGRLGKHKGEDARIDDCLTTSLSSGRSHGMSRIAQQRHPTEAPSWQRVAIHLMVF